MAAKTSRFAYGVHPGPGPEEGSIFIVEQDIKGYRLIPDYDCSPKDRRKGIAKRLNKQILKISQKQADILIAHSM